MLSAAISIEISHGLTVNQITNLANIMSMLGDNLQYIADILSQTENEQKMQSSAAANDKTAKTAASNKKQINKNKADESF